MSEGLAMLLLLSCAAYYWHSGRVAYERTIEVSKAVCKEINVQLLDDSVVLDRQSIAMIRQGPTIRRIYFFEFCSNGNDRRRGEITLHSSRVECIRIEHPDGSYFFNLPGTV
ncbi:MAG: hypothetical protein ACI9BW_000381 [Gammaproteobacteria bacterium]|jgi:hypothetical protein